jgi:hypothetical protein
LASKHVLHKTEGIPGSSESSEMIVVMSWGSDEDHKVMTEAVVGISGCGFPKSRRR